MTTAAEAAKAIQAALDAEPAGLCKERDAGYNLEVLRQRRDWIHSVAETASPYALRALLTERTALLAAREQDAMAFRIKEEECERLKAWKARVIAAAEVAHGPDAVRFKLSLRRNGTATNEFPKHLDQRWVSFVYAEDDAHIGYIAKALAAQQEKQG
jgi:hypothetical protein